MAGVASTIPAWVPIATTVVGSVLGAKGQMDAGDAARVSGQRTRAAREFEAAQLEQQAGQAVAVAQRQAIEQRRSATLAQSRALALAAAGGGGASDSTIVNIISGIAGEGAYRSAVAMYEGDERARQLRMGATTRRLEGEVAEEGGRKEQKAYRIGAVGSVLRGAGSLYGKYAMGGPTAGGLSSGASIGAGIDAEDAGLFGGAYA